jgi:hypothetical protein
VRAQATTTIGPQLEITATIVEVQEAWNACSKCAVEVPPDIVPLEISIGGKNPCKISKQTILGLY